MPGLDLRYIPSKYFQEAILDKTTGCPLAAGVVTFHKDIDRTPSGLKPVFQLTGSPPNYTYTELPNPITLSSIGTFQDDSNNDIIPYFFPYDDDGKLELYSATVVSAGSTPQFTREGFPNLGVAEEDDEQVKNFIPNGQFLLHNNIVADLNGDIEAGEITSDVVDIAQGGWTFERTSGSSAKDFVLFDRIGSFVSNPSKSPRYSMRVKNESPSVSDTFKDVRVKFRDVNKFASETNPFTFAFQAKSNTGSSSLIEVKLIKNYGTGGTSQITTLLETINLTLSYEFYDIPIIFGINDGKTIGDDDDDFIQLVISFPVSNVFDDSFDNFILLDGDKQIAIFPDTTDAEFIRDSLAGLPPVPDYEGKNLGLPVILGLQGFEYDASSIGDWVPKSHYDLGTYELWSDGNKYRVAAYSAVGVPYRRLYEKWAALSTIGLSQYGTGDDEMRIVKAPVADQSFTDETNDLTGTDDWQSFTAGNNDILRAIQIKIAGTAPATIIVQIYNGVGTTGLLRSQNDNYVPVVGVNTIYLTTPFIQNISAQYTLRIKSVSTLTWKGNTAGGYVGGSYDGGAGDAYFVTLTEPTTDPAIYALKSNTSGTVTAAADGATPTGFTFTAIHPDPYVVNITFLAASSVTAGSYFTFNTTDSRKYIPWYRKDGSGTQPVESADVYMPVDIAAADTAEILAKKTAVVINSYSIKVPNFQGYFIRATDNGAGNDPDADNRLKREDEKFGDFVGTTQPDEYKSHTHGASVGTGPSGAVFGEGTVTGTYFTDASGGSETRAKNFYANLAVKY